MYRPIQAMNIGSTAACLHDHIHTHTCHGRTAPSAYQPRTTPQNHDTPLGLQLVHLSVFAMAAPKAIPRTVQMRSGKPLWDNQKADATEKTSGTLTMDKLSEVCSVPLLTEKAKELQ